MSKLRAFELRTKSKKDLLGELNELKTELSNLRVAQATNKAPAKVAKIKSTRKNIARVLTVLNTNALKSMREQTKGLKHIPKQLRAKKTRAIRRALTPEQANKKTPKAAKKAANFAVRKFAVVA